MEKQDHEFCLRCGRKLKNPRARELGYGAVCLQKLSEAGGRRLFRPGVHSTASGGEAEIGGEDFNTLTC